MNNPKAFEEASDIEAKTPISAGTRDVQTCFAIESAGSSRSFLRMEKGMFVWTSDFRLALKFFDRASADQVAEECEEADAIREHIMYAG